MNLQSGQYLIQHDTPATAMTHGQRNARIHRLGQKQNVELMDVAANHPMEKKARERLRKKYALREFMLDRMEGMTVDAEDVVAMNVMRSDQGVANYFWVSNQSWAMVTNQTAKEMAQYGTKDSFQQFEHPNCAMSIFGVRKMELQTSLGDPEFSYTESAKAETLAKNRVLLAGWVEKRRNALVAMNRDNAVFESGTIRLRGNESIKAGMMLTITRGRMASQYYAHRVDHDFVPYQGFFTTVTVDRGTGFIDRTQVKDAPFHGGSNPRGVS